MIKITNQEIIQTIKYLNFCGLCTTGDCKNCARKMAKDKVLKLLEEDKEKQIKIGVWILCKDKMPEEHDSIFAKLKGTDKWNTSMFEKISDDVNVTVEFEDGKRKTMTLHTCDGIWKTDMRIVKFDVLAWQPLPDTYLD